MSKSPEFKKMMGLRQLNDDGFTYRYGKHRNGYSVAAKRDIDSIGKQVRADKRSVRAAELRRETNTKSPSGRTSPRDACI